MKNLFKFKKINLFVSILLLASFSYAQENANESGSPRTSAIGDLLASALEQHDRTSQLPRQSDIVKRGAKAYFPRLMNNLSDNLLSQSGLGDFKLYQHLHQENPDTSPFSIFNANSYKQKTTQQNSFSFYNKPEDMQDVIVNEFGFCAGFSVVLRKFNMLAYFDDKNVDNEDVPSKKRNPEAWFEFYKNKIDTIMNNQMTVIPQFKNLYAFSKDPQIAKYIKENIILQWEKTNVNFIQGLNQGFLSVTKKMNAQQTKKLHEHLKERLSYGYNPIVYLAKPNDDIFGRNRNKDSETEKIKWYQLKAVLGKLKVYLQEASNQWIHVLMVTEVSDINEDGSYVIKLWDVNDPVASGAAIKRVTVSENGSLSYNYDYTIHNDGSLFLGGRKYTPQSFSGNYIQFLKQIEENETTLSYIAPLKWDELEIERMIKNSLDFCYEHRGQEGQFCTKKTSKPILQIP